MSLDSGEHDPELNVLALQQEHALREASRLVALAEARLADAQLPEIDFLPLRNRIATLEKAVTGKGSRQIQGRRRYRAKRGWGRQNAQAADMSLFIDESGSWLPPNESDRDDWFALGAVAMTKDSVERYATAANEIKLDFFGDPNITFHEPQMRRSEMKFDFGRDHAKSERFLSAVDSLVSATEFTAFGVGIRKQELMNRSVDGLIDRHLPADPYALALHLLLERFVDFLAYHGRPKSSIVMESQQAHLDAVHQLTVAQTIVHGTQYVAPQGFQRLLSPGVEFVVKQGSHPTELADMLARDVFEWIRSDCRQDPLRWTVFRDKFYKRGDLRRGRFGLKVFPSSDIATEVEKNRVRARN